MSVNGWTHNTLCACLLTLPAVELKGMVLLREYPPGGGCFPTGVPRDRLVEAVTEIVAYTERSRRAAEVLVALSPIPLRTLDVLEFGI